jgi:tetratricopeptide (TPR) repeat protein
MRRTTVSAKASRRNDLEDLDTELLAAGRELREHPDDVKKLERCMDLARKTNALEELELLLEDIATQASQPEARVRLHRVLADLLLARGDQDGAEATLKNVEHLGASAAGELPPPSTRDERIEQVYLLSRELNRAESKEEQAGLLLQLGELYERLGDIEMATESFFDAYAIDPGPEVLAALKRVNHANS